MIKTDLIIVDDFIDDSDIRNISKKLKIKDKLISPHFRNTHFFYFLRMNNFKPNTDFLIPWQTFSKHDIEKLVTNSISGRSSKKKIENDLIEIASQYFEKSCFYWILKKKSIDLAAVFAINFSNYMFYIITQDFWKMRIFSFGWIKPLIKRTVWKT